MQAPRMACEHPGEERQRVYHGTTSPLADRQLCGLCGEIVYLVPDAATLRAPADVVTRYRATEPARRYA